MDKSSLEFKKEDGSPIKFNFELPNGLPYKDIIMPEFSFVYSKETNEYGIYMTLKESDLGIIKILEVRDVKFFNNDECWLIFDDCYIILSEFDDKIIKEIQKNNLIFCFFDIKENFISGFKIK